MDTPKGKFIKGFLWTGFGFGARKGLGLLTMLIALRLMPPGQFGVYVLFDALLWFFLTLGDGGLSYSSTQALTKDQSPEGQRQVMHNALILRIAFLAVTGCVPLIGKTLAVNAFHSSSLGPLMSAMPALILLAGVQELFSSFLLATGREKEMAHVQTLAGILGFGVAFILIAFFQLQAKGLVYAALFSSAWSALHQGLILRMGKGFSIDKKSMSDLLKFGMPLQINSILSYIFTRTDSLLVGALCGPDGAAYYGAAAKFIDMARQTFDPFQLVFFPAVSRLSAEQRRERIGSILKMTLWFIGLASFVAIAALLIFQNLIVHYILTPMYQVSGPLLPLLACGLTALLMNQTMGMTLVALGHPKEILKINGAATVLNVLANVAFIRLFGFKGAAFGSILTHWVAWVAYVFSLKKCGFELWSASPDKAVGDMVSAIGLGGVRIDNLTLEETLKRIDGYIERKETRVVLTLNVHGLVVAYKDPALKRMFNSADLIVADGVPLLWAARFFAEPLKGRVNGTDLFCKICQVGASKKYKLFLLGAAPGVAQQAAERLCKKSPGFEIETLSPPYGFDDNESENAKVFNRITQVKPDVLFLGISVPRQELWIWRHKDLLPPMVFVNAGASFDLIAGKFSRAPLWMQRNGLEWLWRTFQEPSRLGPRYLGDLVPFFRCILTEKLRSL